MAFLCWLAALRGSVALVAMLRERAPAGPPIIARHGRPRRIAMALGGQS
jgi:hypothetical protein